MGRSCGGGLEKKHIHFSKTEEEKYTSSRGDWEPKKKHSASGIGYKTRSA